MLTNKHNLPESYYKAVESNAYDITKRDMFTISATEIVKPLREIILLRRYGRPPEDCSEKFWTLFGSAVHYAMERITGKIEGDDILKECRLYHRIPCRWTITGKPDIVYGKTIEDYKITSVNTLFYNPEGTPEWAAQLNIYAWLLKKTRNIDIENLRVTMLFRDHMSSKTVNHTYPQTPVKQIAIPNWGFEKTQKYIEEKLLDIDAHLSASIPDEALPKCSMRERWNSGVTFAVIKHGAKRALKVCKTQAEANEWKSKNNNNTTIQTRKGIDRKCEKYCPVRKNCLYSPDYKEKEVK